MTHFADRDAHDVAQLCPALFRQLEGADRGEERVGLPAGAVVSGLPMSPWEFGLLFGAGLAAGVVNTLAGAGSLITVPVLVLLGLPGTLANGTNRVGILAHNLIAAWRFRAEGVSGLRPSLPFVLPVMAGALAGSLGISLLSDRGFERLFAVVMLILVVPLLRTTASPPVGPPWPAWARTLAFFTVGLFGGAVQAGVGLLILVALAHSGTPLLLANSMKVVIAGALTVVAFLVFALQGKIVWLPGLVLALGSALGGVLGVRIAVLGGERILRPVLALAVLALSGRLLGLY